MTGLKFGMGNAKLGKEVFTFSLPSGWTCPYAKDCFSKAVPVNSPTLNEILQSIGTYKGTGTHIQDGPDTQFRCFSASQEALIPSVFRARVHNLAILRMATNAEEMAGIITRSLPKKAKII